MRTLCILSGLLISFLLQLTVMAESRIREVQNFNFDWQFIQGNQRPDSLDQLEDSDWIKVQLPHDAAISGKFSRDNSTGANGWLPYGQGWYRKQFTLDQGYSDKKIFVQFDGVYRDAEVYINGIHLGRHLNGYLGFEHDISQYLKFGRHNILLVHYDNSTKDTSRWYTGEGIYRDVRLVITDQLHIPQYGTYLTTPVVSSEQALVRIQTCVVNDYDKGKRVRLVTEIYDPNGKKVSEAVAAAPIRSGENFEFTQEIEVPSPQRWSCEQPYLYRAVTKIYDGEKPVDDYETVFGIREIRMTPDQGLLLNGEKVIAKGGDMHHDLGCLGSAALEKGYERKLLLLKSMGCNSIRLSHNPHAPVLLDLADQLGILVFNEVYDKWTSQYYGGLESFEDNWPEDLTTFIKRDRNHPSVYIWSMGNEVYKQSGKHEPKFETPEAGADYGVGLFKRMVELTHTLDPSRKVTVGLFPAREKFMVEWEHWNDYQTFIDSNPAEMAFYGDVVSWNYTENMFALDHKRFPQLMFIASESSTNLNFGTRKLSWLELDLAKVIGHYYWTATDYLGESRWPSKVWGRAFFDITDTLTPIGSLYQSFYDDTPMVHLWVYEQTGPLKEWFDKMDNKRWNWYPMSQHWNWENPLVTVQTITNADEVELLLNGQSLGTRDLTIIQQPYCDWQVSYQKGALKAVARNNGKIVAEQILTTASDPVAIKLESDVNSLKANGLDLAYIAVSLIDKNGVMVPNADRLVTFSVEGEGILAGVANSDIFSDEPWVASQKTTFQGKCLLVVRSTRNQGKVTIKAVADSLPDQTLELKCK